MLNSRDDWEREESQRNNFYNNTSAFDRRPSSSVNRSSWDDQFNSQMAVSNDRSNYLSDRPGYRMQQRGNQVVNQQSGYYVNDPRFQQQPSQVALNPQEQEVVQVIQPEIIAHSVAEDNEELSTISCNKAFWISRRKNWPPFYRKEVDHHKFCCWSSLVLFLLTVISFTVVLLVFFFKDLSFKYNVFWALPFVAFTAILFLRKSYCYLSLRTEAKCIVFPVDNMSPQGKVVPAYMRNLYVQLIAKKSNIFWINMFACFFFVVVFLISLIRVALFSWKTDSPFWDWNKYLFSHSFFGPFFWFSIIFAVSVISVSIIVSLVDVVRIRRFLAYCQCDLCSPEQYRGILKQRNIRNAIIFFFVICFPLAIYLIVKFFFTRFRGKR